MAIYFRGVTSPPLHELTASAPDGSIIGIVGLAGSGQTALLRLAAGIDSPLTGTVEGPAGRRFIAFGKPLDLTGLAPGGLLCAQLPLAVEDPLSRGRSVVELDRLRGTGATILLASHDDALLMRLADELWWLNEGVLAATGYPQEVFSKYSAHVAEKLAEWGRTVVAPIDTASRRGDARAELVAISTASSSGIPSAVLRSHEPALVRVVVRFLESLDNPVVGILLRTRVGMEVYGTNTELEGVALGECKAGEQVTLDFQFQCTLCPGDYTVTAACHQSDGTVHDWIDDAVVFSVAANRYTAGVADLRASVSLRRG